MNFRVKNKLSLLASVALPLHGQLLFCVLAAFQPVSANAFEVHRYEVKKENFSIYPANVALLKRQQHAALYQLVDQISRMGPQARIDFARISLHEMAALYEKEARRPDVNGMLIAEGAALNRWQRSTLNYADRLYTLAGTVSMQTELEIDIADTGELLLLINGEPVILGGPAVQDKLLLDRRIIEAYCRQYGCTGTSFGAELPAMTRTVTIRFDWLIEEGKQPELITSDGLHFIFNNLENRRKKQRICLEISKELKMLEETLRDALADGLYIDWETFSIRPLYGSYDYRIVINPFGDSVYMQFPALHPVKKWPSRIMGWLRARLRGEVQQHFFNPDDLVAFGFE